MRIKAVVSDFDGTLFDSFSNFLKSAKDLFRELGRPFRKRDAALIREMWGDTLANIVAALFPDASPALHSRNLRRWIAHLLTREEQSPSRLFPGTNRALAAMKRMGLVVAIATNRRADKLYETLLPAKLDVKRIDFIIAWNPSRTFAKFLKERSGPPRFIGTPYRKPDRRYLAMLNRYLAGRGILPHEVVFCGDALFDAEASRVGGYNFIPVLTGPAGTTNAWWEARLSAINVPPLAIATSIKDVPLLIKTLNKMNDSEETPD